jgi:hypothetical protein
MRFHSSSVGLNRLTLLLFYKNHSIRKTSARLGIPA